MDIIKNIKQSEQMKQFVLRMLMPARQARPRRWVRWFILPFTIQKGKGALIRRNSRFDVLPINKFTLGDYSTIEDYTTINNGVGDVLIGKHTRIGIGSVIIGPVVVGNKVRLAQHVVVSGLNHNYESVNEAICDQGVSTKEVFIGSESWVGANAVILPGVKIGKHCVVAAGSVVTKNVDDYTVVAGNPAKPVKKLNPSTLKWEKVTLSLQAV